MKTYLEYQDEKSHYPNNIKQRNDTMTDNKSNDFLDNLERLSNIPEEAKFDIIEHSLCTWS